MAVYYVVAALAAALIVYAVLLTGRRSRRLPPGLLYLLLAVDEYLQNIGPPTVPILGNLPQIPTKRTYLKPVHDPAGRQK